ncbi:MAG TPA: hypothetical protein VJS69_11535, partial [Candidatus Krumholzibacteria bacterium]|nr:hypothetical protein [Candidatus Krumholzibacteria bacterium]
MKRTLLLLILVSLVATASFAKTPDKEKDKKPNSDTEAKDEPKPGESKYFKPESVTTKGSVTVEGSRVDYDAICGTIVVHPRGWDDAAKTDKDDKKDEGGDHNPDAEASMFY